MRYFFCEIKQYLVKYQLSSCLAIAFDLSYINKSGKFTPYLNRFRSGCVKRFKYTESVKSQLLGVILGLYENIPVFYMFVR
jgi:hypothetical protein